MCRADRCVIVERIGILTTIPGRINAAYVFTRQESRSVVAGAKRVAGAGARGTVEGRPVAVVGFAAVVARWLDGAGASRGINEQVQ